MAKHEWVRLLAVLLPVTSEVHPSVALQSHGCTYSSECAVIAGESVDEPKLTVDSQERLALPRAW